MNQLSELTPRSLGSVLFLITTFHPAWGNADSCFSQMQQACKRGHLIKVFFMGPGVLHLISPSPGVPFSVMGLRAQLERLQKNHQGLFEYAACRTSHLRWIGEPEEQSDDARQGIKIVSMSEMFIAIGQSDHVQRF